jgi:general stress protein 26
MLTQPQRVFLQKRVMDIQQAIFYNTSQAVLKLPTSIINALHVDDVGQVWFMVNRPPQHLSEFDREFLAKLHFYKKGKKFYLHVVGKASIVSDPEDINNTFELSDEIRRLASTSMVLVRMKITEINYYPSKVHHTYEKKEIFKYSFHPSAFFKTLQYIVKDIIPVFQSH